MLKYTCNEEALDVCGAWEFFDRLVQFRQEAITQLPQIVGSICGLASFRIGHSCLPEHSTDSQCQGGQYCYTRHSKSSNMSI